MCRLFHLPERLLIGTTTQSKYVSSVLFCPSTFKWRCYPIKIHVVCFVFEQHIWVSLLPDQNISSLLYSSSTCKLRQYPVSMRVCFIFEQKFLNLAMPTQKTCRLFHLPETVTNHNTWHLFCFTNTDFSWDARPTLFQICYSCCFVVKCDVLCIVYV
jgi:hypothetical protein